MNNFYRIAIAEPGTNPIPERRGIFDQDEKLIHIFGNVVGTLNMPSPVEVENFLESKFPGCMVDMKKVRRAHGTTYTCTGIKLPSALRGWIELDIETEENPIGGDYENGWETDIIL